MCFLLFSWDAGSGYNLWDWLQNQKGGGCFFVGGWDSTRTTMQTSLLWMTSLLFTQLPNNPLSNLFLQHKPLHSERFMLFERRLCKGGTDFVQDQYSGNSSKLLLTSKSAFALKYALES